MGVICSDDRTENKPNNKNIMNYNQNINNNIFIENIYNNINSPMNNNNINNHNINIVSRNFSSPCCCPSCGEPAGSRFKGSGKDYESFNCLKCGKHKSVSNYYKCNVCNGIFCSNCPFNNKRNKINTNINYNNIDGCSCPACGELSGKNFKGSGKNYESFICLKCGKHQSVSNYYMCNICNGIFCSQCPFLNERSLALCPACGKPAGIEFKGSGKNYESFKCLKCGKHQSVSNYYKCDNCQALFCYKCPFIHS